MRMFVAIEFDEALRADLAGVRDQGLLEGSAVKWVPTDRMHLTLKFLGEVPADIVPAVTEALTHASQGTGPFHVEVEGLGFFPDARRPRVFWAGLKDSEGELEILQRRIEIALCTLGFERESRPFRPHLTLARIKGRADAVNAADADPHVAFGRQRVSEIVLFKSDLRPQGPLYTPLSAVALKE